MDHVAFRMPTFILHISIDLHKLLQDSTIAPNTFGGKPSRVMEVAVHMVLVLIVRILLSEQGGTYRTGEMLHVIFLV